MAAVPVSSSSVPTHSAWEVFLIFLRLGLTSFGGPVAHLGYFREEFVVRRGWLSDRAYADLVALCQFLPGPASSQVGLALGLLRAGYRGALAAWLGFTLPSAVLLAGLGMGLLALGEGMPVGIVHGLKLAAMAVVIQAVRGMAGQLCPDRSRMTLMLVVACVALLWPGTATQLAVVGVSALFGLYHRPLSADVPMVEPVRQTRAWLWLLVCGLLLILLPWLARHHPLAELQLLAMFYQAGTLVFGGGHVVLPLLQMELVPAGWVSQDLFLAGYAAAQTVPGPLFTIAAFLGAVMAVPTGSVSGAVLAILAIFLPSFLLVAGALPYWQRWRQAPHVQAMLAGVNAGVVGLLLAVLYDPLWTSAIQGVRDVVVVILATASLLVWRWPAWLTVVVCGVAGGLLS